MEGPDEQPALEKTSAPEAAPAKRYKHLWMKETRADEKGEIRTYWTKVGVAYENPDGSYSLELSNERRD